MQKNEFLASFGEWLRGCRKALDLTQDELAQRAGCSIFALRKIESEKGVRPNNWRDY